MMIRLAAEAAGFPVEAPFNKNSAGCSEPFSTAFSPTFSALEALPQRRPARPRSLCWIPGWTPRPLCSSPRSPGPSGALPPPRSLLSDLSVFVGSSTTPKIIRLARELPDLRLPSTLVFDYPTLSAGPTACVLSVLCLAAPTSEAVAAYAEEAQRPRERKHREITKQPVASSDPLSVIGGACAFPGRE